MQMITIEQRPQTLNDEEELQATENGKRQEKNYHDDRKSGRRWRKKLKKKIESDFD